MYIRVRYRNQPNSALFEIGNRKRVVRTKTGGSREYRHSRTPLHRGLRLRLHLFSIDDSIDLEENERFHSFYTARQSTNFRIFLLFLPVSPPRVVYDNFLQTDQDKGSFKCHFSQNLVNCIRA